MQHIHGCQCHQHHHHHGLFVCQHQVPFQDKTMYVPDSQMLEEQNML